MIEGGGSGALFQGKRTQISKKTRERPQAFIDPARLSGHGAEQRQLQIFRGASDEQNGCMKSFYKQNQRVSFRFAEMASSRVGGSSFQP
jgi:hypothetical protein